MGRSQPRPSVDGGPETTCFRILKYAIRPVTANPNECVALLLYVRIFKLTRRTSKLRRIPLSAFIVEDMMEFVQAHASYRFIIRDEEEEKPRILVCQMSVRLSINRLI